MIANPLPRLEVVDLAARWGVEQRPIGGRWMLVLTDGTETMANKMLVAVCGTAGGDWCTRRPERRAA